MNQQVCKQLRALARRHTDLPSVAYRNVIRVIRRRMDVKLEDGKLVSKLVPIEKVQRVLHPQCQRALYHHMKAVARRVHE